MIFCSLYSGSSGNSTFISSLNSKILIDAGLSGKHIENALKAINEDPSSIDGIFVTHEHIDHIKAVGVLSRRYDIPIYASEGTWKSMKRSLGKVKDENIKVICKNSIEVKDMEICPFDLPHDASEPFGYSVKSMGKVVTVATDIGYITQEMEERLKESDIILLESNHDVELLKMGPYPYTLKRRILSKHGHLSNEDCGKGIIGIYKGKPIKVILGHLSSTNNFPELAIKTVVDIVEESKIMNNKDIFISLADRHNPSAYTTI